METHIESSMFGDSYTKCYVWRFIYRIQYMETHTEVPGFGVSCRMCNVWTLI